MTNFFENHWKLNFHTYFLKFLFLVGIIILPMVFAFLSNSIFLSYVLSFIFILLFYVGVFQKNKLTSLINSKTNNQTFSHQNSIDLRLQQLEAKIENLQSILEKLEVKNRATVEIGTQKQIFWEDEKAFNEVLTIKSPDTVSSLALLNSILKMSMDSPRNWRSFDYFNYHNFILSHSLNYVANRITEISPRVEKRLFEIINEDHTFKDTLDKISNISLEQKELIIFLFELKNISQTSTFTKRQQDSMYSNIIRMFSGYLALTLPRIHLENLLEISEYKNP